MTAFFNWAMRNGAQILFVVAILGAVASFVSSIVGVPGFDAVMGTPAEQPRPLAHVWTVAVSAINALHVAALPFFGAVLINRLDHWREHRA